MDDADEEDEEDEEGEVVVVVVADSGWSGRRWKGVEGGSIEERRRDGEG